MPSALPALVSCAEIDQLRDLAAIRAGGEHDVVRLQIAMDDVVAVGRRQRARHLAENRNRARHRDGAAGLNQRLQARPVDVVEAACVDGDPVRLRPRYVEGVHATMRAEGVLRHAAPAEQGS